MDMCTDMPNLSRRFKPDMPCVRERARAWCRRMDACACLPMPVQQVLERLERLARVDRQDLEWDVARRAVEDQQHNTCRLCCGRFRAPKELNNS